MAQQGAACHPHTEARVVGDKFCVADKIYGVEPVGVVQEAAHQLAAYALTLVLGQDLQPWDKGGEYAVAKHVYKAHYPPVFTFDSYHRPVAFAQHGQVLTQRGPLQPADEESVEHVLVDIGQIVGVVDHVDMPALRVR